jgi:phosphoribosylformylglycinamidine synthase subunit PurL
MADACRALDFPIISGNVSLYNESKATGGGSAILPTPAIGGVGLLDDWEKSATIGLRTTKFDTTEPSLDPSAAIQSIWLVGSAGLGHVGQSLWLQEVHGRRDGPAPAVDLAAERKVGEFIRELIGRDLATAVHDVSDGGVLVAVVEMALATGIGADLLGTDMWSDAQLFGEDQGRYIVTCLTSGEDDPISRLAAERGIPVRWLGNTGGDDIAVGDLGNLGTVSLADLRAAHEGFFPKLMGSELTPEF